jgi:hypothetical protein
LNHWLLDSLKKLAVMEQVHGSCWKNLHFKSPYEYSVASGIILHQLFMTTLELHVTSAWSLTQFHKWKLLLIMWKSVVQIKSESLMANYWKSLHHEAARCFMVLPLKLLQEELREWKMLNTQ